MARIPPAFAGGYRHRAPFGAIYRRLQMENAPIREPGSFFDVEYLLDDEAFRNKDRIIVTLQARPGATAGGLFGARTMIVEDE